MTIKASILDFEDISIGDIYSFQKTISSIDVLKFAELTGDYNPLHVDHKFGAKSIFKQNIVHGMLCSGFFSTLVGMYCPGEKCLYLSQTLQFRRPLFYDDTILIKGIILEKSPAAKVIKIKTEILRGEDIIVTGEARIQFL
jgi:3-hydroxybutyryl-CoA dehydratase